MWADTNSVEKIIFFVVGNRICFIVQVILLNDLPVSRYFTISANHISTTALFIVFNAKCKKLWTTCRYCVTSHSSSYVNTSGCFIAVIINRCPTVLPINCTSGRTESVYLTTLFVPIFFVLFGGIRMKRIFWSPLYKHCYITVLVLQLNMASLMT